MQATLERLRRRRDEEGREGGFTLIELLIVIVILAILAAIVVFAVQNLTGQSAKAACNTDYKTVESATEAFKAQTGAYPGGTYSGGVTVTAVADPTGYTSPTVSAATLNGIDFLMQSTDTDGSGNAMGPWLKDAPVNPSHYEIVVSADGKGALSVYNGAGTAAVSGGCAGVN
jgi:prepilin-type N-terminal cleavage/methylation domain-containing protein